MKSMTKMISLVRTMCVMAIVSLLAQCVWAEGTADENGITPSIWYTFDEGASPVSNHGSYAKSGDKDVTSGEFALVSGTDYAWKIGSSTLELAALNDGLVNMYPATYRVKIDLNGQTYANAVIWGTNGKAYNGPVLVVNGDPTTGYTVKLHRHDNSNVGNMKLSYTVPADKVTGYHSYVVTIAAKSNNTCATTLFVDGVQVGTMNENWGTQNSGTLLGQAGNGYSKVATGLLYSDFRFYTQTFTAAQVATLEGVPFPMYYNQLAGSETIPAGTYGAITIDESTGGFKATSFASQGTISGGVGSFAQIINRASNGRVDTRSHTVSGWFRINSLGGLLYAAKTGNTGDHVGYKVFVDSNGKINIGKVKWSSGGFAWNGNVMTTASACVTAGTWHHIAIAITKLGDDSGHTGSAKVFVDGAEVSMATSPANFATNLDGENCTEIYMGAGVSVGGFYVDPRSHSSVDLIKAIAVDPIFVRAVNSVFKATLTANTNYSAITWDKGTAPASGDAAEITVTADVTLTLDQAIAADSIKVKGENAITLVGEYLTAENLAKIDNSEMTGAVKVNAVPSWDLKTSDNLTYLVGAGTSDARKAITQDGGAITLAGSGATYYLNGGASGTSSTVTFDGSTVDYGTGVISVGVATYNFNDATVTADRLVTSNEADGRNSTINISGNSSITLANTTLATGTGAAVLLGHWKSASTTFNLAGGTLDVANGGFRIGWDSAANATIGGGTTAATLKAKQVKMGGERSNTCSLTIGSNGTVEIGESGMHIASGTLTLNGGTIKAMANNTISVPGTLALSAPSTIDSNGYDVTLTVSGTMSGTGSIAKVGEGKLTMGTLRPKMSAFAGQLGLTLTAEEFAAGKIALPVSSDISSSFSTTSVTILKPNGTDAATWATENPITYNSETGAVEFNLAAIAPITVDTADKSFSAAIGDATTGVLAIVGTDSDETAFTVTIDCEVPEGVSVVVSGHVKFVATEGNTVPFGTMTYNEGATITLPSVSNSTIPSGVTMNVGTLSGTITNNGTLNVTGTCSFKLINNGTITFKNGANATVSANDQSIRGTVNVEKGAIFTNVTNDAVSYGNPSTTFNVYGTLEMGGSRWTIGSSSMLNLYGGCSVSGRAVEGQVFEGSFDLYHAGDVITVNADPTGTSNEVTIDSYIRARNNTADNPSGINVAENMTLIISGGIKDNSTESNVACKRGSGKLVVESELSNDAFKVDAGTLKLEGVNPTTPVTVNANGKLELSQPQGSDYEVTAALSGSGRISCVNGTTTISNCGSFTGNLQAEGANSKLVVNSDLTASIYDNDANSGTIEIPVGKTLTTSAFAGAKKVLVNGTYKFASTTQMDLRQKNLSFMTGSGEMYITGSEYFILPKQDWMWSSDLTIVNDRGGDNADNKGIIFGVPNNNYVIGNLSGTGLFRTDYESGTRNVKIVQSKDTTWSGLFRGTDRLGTFEVDGKAGVEGSHVLTLATTNPNTHENALKVDQNGSVKLTGTWKGDVTVNGRFEKMNDATFDGTISGYSGILTKSDSLVYFGSDALASAEAAAKVGTTYYATIADAVAALGEGQNATAITLVGDSVTELPEGQEDYKIVDGVIVAKTYYTITVAKNSTVTVSGLPESVREDSDAITFTVTPAESHNLTAVKANGETLTAGEDGNYSVKIVADTEITTETAIKQVTITIPAITGAVASYNGEIVSGSITVDYGTSVTITYSAAEGYMMTSTSASLTATESTTITAPEGTTPQLIVAKIGDNSFETLQSAINSVGETATTIILAAACAETVAVPANVTIDVNSKSFTGAVTGEGTIVYTGALPDAATCASLKNEAWTGTVVIKNYTTGNTYVKVGNYANAGSNLTLDNVKAYIYTNGTADNPNLVCDTLTIGAGGVNPVGTFSSSKTKLFFNKLVGSGSILVTTNKSTGYNFYCLIGDASEFTGTIDSDYSSAAQLVFAETEDQVNALVGSDYTARSVCVMAGATVSLGGQTSISRLTGGVFVSGSLVATGTVKPKNQGSAGPVKLCSALATITAPTIDNISSGVDHMHVVGDGSESNPYSLAMDQVTITITAVEHTTVTVDGAASTASSITVDYGTNHTIVYTADMNYKINGEGSFTLENVTADTTVGNTLSVALIETEIAPSTTELQVVVPQGADSIVIESADVEITADATAIPFETGVYTVKAKKGETVVATETLGVIAAKEKEAGETPAKVTTAVAVPFTGATIANLLNTKLLEKGSFVMAYIGDAYCTWELAEDKTWTSISGAPAAAETDLKRGTAVWVTTAGKVVVLGKYDTTTEIAAPTAKETHLLANPTMSNYTPKVSDSDPEDQVMKIGEATPTRYTKKNGAWTKSAVKKYINGNPVYGDVVEDPVIPVGKGFWFIKK